jgi:hypothetical protein
MSENTNNEISTEEVSVPAAEPVKIEEPTQVEEIAEAEEAIVEEPKIEEAPAVNSDVIEMPKPSEKQGLGPVGSGAMGVATFKEEKKPKPAKVATKVQETVAIHSTKNVTWQGVGKVFIGYNIVTKEASAQWLKRGHTRLATPEEVAKEFGK